MTIDVSNDRVMGFIESRSSVTAQQIDDFVSTAFEGGITYWCFRAEPNCDTWPDGVDYASQCLTRGYGIVLYDSEDVTDEGNPSEYILTLSNMLSGIQMFCDLHNKSYNMLCEDYDASDADCIVQYALFGKLVYG